MRIERHFADIGEEYENRDFEEYHEMLDKISHEQLQARRESVFAPLHVEDEAKRRKKAQPLHLIEDEHD